MNKVDLVNAIHSHLQGTKVQAEQVVDIIIDSITSTLKKGDEVFFYHSNEGTDIVGIAKVIKEAYQDPTTDDDRWVCVDIKPHKKLKTPVPLATIKKDNRLAGMALVRIGRLSVQPVTEKEWDIILELAGEK